MSDEREAPASMPGPDATAPVNSVGLAPGTAARRARCYGCGKRRLVYPDIDGQRTCRRCNVRLFFEGRRSA